MAEPLTWRNVSTPNLRDFIGYDGERHGARIYQTPNVPEDWTWRSTRSCQRDLE